MGEAGNDLPLDVGQDGGELLAGLGGGARELVAQLAGTQAGQDRERLSLGEVAGDPVDEATPFLAERLEIDVAAQGSTPRR